MYALNFDPRIRWDMAKFILIRSIFSFRSQSNLMCPKREPASPSTRNRANTYAKPPDAIQALQLDIHNRKHIEYLEFIGIRVANGQQGAVSKFHASVSWILNRLTSGLTLVHQPDPGNSAHALGLPFIQELQALAARNDKIALRDNIIVRLEHDEHIFSFQVRS